MEKMATLYISNGILFSSHLDHAHKDLAKAGTKRLGILLSILKKKDDWHCWVENQ